MPRRRIRQRYPNRDGLRFSKISRLTRAGRLGAPTLSKTLERCFCTVCSETQSALGDLTGGETLNHEVDDLAFARTETVTRCAEPSHFPGTRRLDDDHRLAPAVGLRLAAAWPGGAAIGSLVSGRGRAGHSARSRSVSGLERPRERAHGVAHGGRQAMTLPPGRRATTAPIPSRNR